MVLMSACRSAAGRDISPILQKFRSILNGRDVTIPVRFQKEMAARPGPEANIPEGTSHKVSANYYFTRDARREVERPVMVVDNTSDKAKALEAGTEPSAAGDGAEKAVAAPPAPKGGKMRTPGPLYNYST